MHCMDGQLQLILKLQYQAVISTLVSKLVNNPSLGDRTPIVEKSDLEPALSTQWRSDMRHIQTWLQVHFLPDGVVMTC